MQRIPQMPSNHPSRMPGLTSSVTGPDDGIASPMLLGGDPLPNLLDLNSVARPGARGVRLLLGRPGPRRVPCSCNC
jgi:hypothetical protein